MPLYLAVPHSGAVRFEATDDAAALAYAVGWAQFPPHYLERNRSAALQATPVYRLIGHAPAVAVRDLSELPLCPDDAGKARLLPINGAARERGELPPVDVAAEENKPHDTLAGQTMGVPLKPQAVFAIPEQTYGFANKRLSWAVARRRPVEPLVAWRTEERHPRICENWHAEAEGNRVRGCKRSRVRGVHFRAHRAT